MIQSNREFHKLSDYELIFVIAHFYLLKNLVTPTHYFGEPNYISDTENTTVLGTNNEGVRPPLLSVDVVAAQKRIEENAAIKKDEL